MFDGVWPGPRAAPVNAANYLERLNTLRSGLNQIGERQPPVDPDEFLVVPGLGGIHLGSWEFLPCNDQGLGVGELPNEPTAPMAYRLTPAEIGELLNALSQSAIARASCACFADVEDVRVLDPLLLQGGLEQRWVPPLEPAAHTFREEQSFEVLGFEHHVDSG